MTNIYRSHFQGHSKTRSNRLVPRFEFRTSLLNAMQAENLFPPFPHPPHSRRRQKEALLTGWLSGSVEVLIASTNLTLHQRTVFFCPFVFSFSVKYTRFGKTLQCFHCACFEVHIVLGEFFINAYNLFPLFFYVIYEGSKWEIKFCR